MPRQFVCPWRRGRRHIQEVPIQIFYGWWIVLTCFFISLYVSSVIFFGLTAFFEPIVKEFGWSYTQVSFAASLRGMEMGVFAPILGFLVDRFGSRKILFCGTLTVGLGLLLLSYTRSLTMFYLSFLLLAFGAGGCTSLVTMNVVGNWFHKSAGRAFGIMASGFGASGLLIPVIVWLIEAYNWRIALVVLGLGMWVMGIPLVFLIRNVPEDYGLVPDGRSAPPPESEIPPASEPFTFWQALSQRSFLYLNLAEFARMIVVTAVVTHVMPYLSSVGLSRSTAGWIAAAIPLTSIIGRVGFGWLGDIFEKKYIMALTFILMALGMLAFCYVQFFWMVFLFLALFSPSFGGMTVLRGAILRDNFGRGSFGRMLGIVMGSASLGGIIGPSLAGWIFDQWRSYHYTWMAFALLAGLSLLFVLRIQSFGRMGGARTGTG